MKNKLEHKEDQEWFEGGAGRVAAYPDREIFTKYLYKLRKYFNCSVVRPSYPELLDIISSDTEEDDHVVEIRKAAAQAWHSHSDTSTATNEFDFSRLNLKSKPSRFKIEAMNKPLNKTQENAHWDFAGSLWDSYEIVSTTKKLESVLVLGHQFSESDYRKRRKESGNSLRSLFSKSSRRDIDEEISHDEND